MYKSFFLWVRRLVLFALVAVPGVASAATYYGCLYCKYERPTGIAATCMQVGDGQNGDGTQCDDYPGMLGGSACYTNNDPCFGIIVNGGGGSGGGGGGGGGSSCGRGAGGVCEAQCFSCGGGQRQ